MSLIKNTIPNLGLYKYSLAATDIAKSYGIHECSLRNDMASAIRKGNLKVRDPITGAIFSVTPNMEDASPWVTKHDVNSWLNSDGRNYEWNPIPIVKRSNEMIAFLNSCFDSGVQKTIDDVWQHMRSNAGKENFLFKGVSKETATTINGKPIKKQNLARTLGRLTKS